MIFVAHALDKTDALDRRLGVIDAHRAYLADAPSQYGVEILMSGPLLSDDGTGMKGSFFLFKAKQRSDIETMMAKDPMASADVWDSLTITRVNVRTNTVGPLGEDE